MPEPVLGQLSSFLLFILGGLVLGAVFDLLRVVRAIRRPRGFVSFCLDLAYWLAALAIVFPLLMLGTWGDLRLFVWLALLLGLTYYMALLSNSCRPLIRWLVLLAVACARLPSRALRGAEYVRADRRRGRVGRGGPDGPLPIPAGSRVGSAPAPINQRH